MKQFFINLFGWVSQGDIINYPDGQLLISHSISPDREYTFNEVFVDNIRELLWN